MTPGGTASTQNVPTPIEQALEGLSEYAGLGDRVAELYGRRAAAIRLAHEAGASISGIARKLGVERQIVYDALRAEGSSTT